MNSKHGWNRDRGARAVMIAVCSMALIGLSACGEEAPEPVAPTSEARSATALQETACGLVQGLERDARSWFPQPERRVAQDALRDLRSACSAGNRAAVSEGAWAILSTMEAVSDAGRGGAPSVGSNLARGLLACTRSLCAPEALPQIDLTGALGATGLFAVRGPGTVPATSRGTVGFADFQGVSRKAWWVVEVSDSWSVVTGVPRTLFFGAPAQGSAALTPDELPFGSLQFDLQRFPDNGNFRNDALHVAVCFDGNIEVPHAGGDDRRPTLRPLMQREGVLLEKYDPEGCAAGPQSVPVLQASMASSLNTAVRRVASLLFPATEVARDDLLIRGLGGSAMDFSRFAPVAALGDGTLEFLTLPPAVVDAGTPLGTIKVRARSGNGTPIEQVLVRLYVENNQGFPAGAELSGQIESRTREEAGLEGVASFPDGGDPLTIGKAGGYILCAEAVLEGFDFPRVCTDRFHVRNAR